MTHTLFIPGIPIPKGSAKAFVIKGTNRAVVTQTNRDKQRPWASLIAVMARNAGVTPSHGPVKLSMSFWFPRPKSHYRTGKHAAELRPDAPTKHTGKPDGDKLQRCVWDALTGIAYLDDSQVCEWGIGGKWYSDEKPGCAITIEKLEVETKKGEG